ncbi:hypothetical protein KUTeg_019683 [Tegillarca granosa]|uniref:B box-type domain-containing protein n=1 Tax=Tegillarca granosa TaxID=220873 RepID=A0ABQ9EHA5_TEGGR|nr:hypothetical protein KUTeg_019683 [Tegillarca granosa]
MEGFTKKTSKSRHLINFLMWFSINNRKKLQDKEKESLILAWADFITQFKSFNQSFIDFQIQKLSFEILSKQSASNSNILLTRLPNNVFLVPTFLFVNRRPSPLIVKQQSKCLENCKIIFLSLHRQLTCIFEPLLIADISAICFEFSALLSSKEDLVIGCRSAEQKQNSDSPLMIKDLKMAAYTPTFDFQAAIEKCELCQEEDAQYFCTNCQEEMCNSCKTAHLRSKASRDHNVISTSLEKSYRMYCTSCDEAVCVKCATSIKHKNHNFEELETTFYKYQDEISSSVIETKQQKEEHTIESRNIKVPSITHINPPSFVSDATLNLQNIFGKLTDSLESTSTQKVSEKGKEQKEKMKLDVSLDSSSSVTTISTDIVSKLNPGVRSECVSPVNDKEAWCGGDYNLVLIDIHGHVKKKIQPKNALWAVVITTKGELFVTEINRTNIIKYSPDGKRTKIGNTKPYTTQGLCNTSVPDNILVCLYNKGDNDSKVVRMTTAGHIKQTIQNNKQQKSLYKYPRYVAENINEDVIVVDGCYPSTIVVVDKRGEYRYTYPDSSQSSHTIDWCYGTACDNT